MGTRWLDAESIKGVVSFMPRSSIERLFGSTTAPHWKAADTHVEALQMAKKNLESISPPCLDALGADNCSS